MVTVQPSYLVRDAVALLHEHRVSQLPVVSEQDPQQVIGAVGERGLLRHAARDSALLDSTIAEVMEPPFPAVAADDPVREAVELLVEDQQALLVMRNGLAEGSGHPHGPARSAGLVSAPGSNGHGFGTRAVHAGLDPDPTYRSVIPPIHQTSTYAQERPGGFVEDYDYARSANPTRSALERGLGALEGGRGVALRRDSPPSTRCSPSRAAPARTSSCRPTSTVERTGSSTRC